MKDGDLLRAGAQHWLSFVRATPWVACEKVRDPESYQRAREWWAAKSTEHIGGMSEQVLGLANENREPLRGSLWEIYKYTTRSGKPSTSNRFEKQKGCGRCARRRLV